MTNLQPPGHGQRLERKYDPLTSAHLTVAGKTDVSGIPGDGVQHDDITGAPDRTF